MDSCLAESASKKRMAEDSVQLLGYWASPIALRVKWALKLKGVSYEYIEEDLINKSDRLLQYNPVYKKIPVLVHNGKALAESLVILEYIDEVWKQNPLFSQDPHEKAKARFWAKFTDDKCVPAIEAVFSKTGEEQQKAKEEALQHLKTLESGLEGRQLFGGEAIGFVDIVAGWIGCWARINEEVVGVNLIDAKTMPVLDAWFQNFFNIPIVKECMPPWDELLEHNKAFHKTLLSSRA